MDIIEPYHDDEAKGVLFEVEVEGRTAQGYISSLLLSQLCGGDARPPDWVAVYRRHQALIDSAVARRAAAEGWDTVMVRKTDLAGSLRS